MAFVMHVLFLVKAALTFSALAALFWPRARAALGRPLMRWQPLAAVLSVLFSLLIIVWPASREGILRDTWQWIGFIWCWLSIVQGLESGLLHMTPGAIFEHVRKHGRITRRLDSLAVFTSIVASCLAFFR